MRPMLSGRGILLISSSFRAPPPRFRRSRACATSTACRSSFAAPAPAIPAVRFRRSGGIVLSMARLNRILEIDEANLIAVVEPNVINGDLQRAVEAVGLFYPPDPASLETSSIGGNVAECAGGPRAFKYGTTKRYVLALEAVLPDRRDRAHGIEGGEERRRLRPDAAAGRLGRDAGDHHEDHAQADPEAAGSRHALGVVCVACAAPSMP